MLGLGGQGGLGGLGAGGAGRLDNVGGNAAQGATADAGAGANAPDAGGGSAAAGSGGREPTDAPTFAGRPSSCDPAAPEQELRNQSGCWFAYLSEDAPTRLHFRDVFLRDDLVLPEAAGVGSVIDFEFSPDGDWIAFRALAPSGPRLFTYRARGSEGSAAAQIDFDCSDAEPLGDAGAPAPCGVLDYAWSGDSRHLAVVLNGTSPGQDYLSGLSGFDAESGPGAPWPAQSSALWVADETPLDYREQLVWVDSEWVGFLGPELGSSSPTLKLALYGASASGLRQGSEPVEANPQMLGPEGTRLRSSSGGALMIEPAGAVEASAMSFHQAGSFTMIHAGWLSPSGAWVASITGGELEIYDVRDDFDPVAASASEAGGVACSAILSWSAPVEEQGLERIACAAGAEVAFYDFHYGQSPKWLEHAGSVSLAPAVGERRAFSPSGKWFVLSRAEQGGFAFVDLSGPAPAVSPTPVRVGAPAELSFPPSEHGLANISDLRGVAEYPLPGAQSARGSAFLFQAARPRRSCEEDFWMAPGNWCGAPRAAQHLEYGADSSRFLFEESFGTLKLARPGAAPDAELVTERASSCSGDCPRTPYAFQP